jgi:hypothetical protein
MAAGAKRMTITRREIGLMIAVGVALRSLWLVLVRGWTEPMHLGEATNAALAFARQGMIADAYFPGQGPTAHLLPTMILVAGAIERLLGPESPAANVALGLWALLQVATGFVLTTALFNRLGASRATLLGGLGLLCLVPAHIASEAADFRVWEGALAFDLAVANLLWIAVLRDRGAIGSRELLVAAGLAAGAFFVSPPAGLAACAAWALFSVTRWPLARTFQLAGLTTLVMAALIVPWTLRNQAQLGRFVPLRSNFGLELAIANFPGALDPVSPRTAAAVQIEAVRQTEERFRAAGGEVLHSRQVGADAQRWIAAHPFAFARLSLRHYRQFYVPDTWVEDATNWQGANRARIRIFQAVGVLGLVGLAIGLWRRRRGYLLLATYIAVAGLPYAVVQPIPRYAYIVYPLLAFLAVELVVSVLASARARGAGSFRPGAVKPR